MRVPLMIFLIAHAKVEKFENPEAPAYDRYSPRLHKHASAIITEWCDAVLFTYSISLAGFGEKFCELFWTSLSSVNVGKVLCVLGALLQTPGLIAFWPKSSGNNLMFGSYFGGRTPFYEHEPNRPSESSSTPAQESHSNCTNISQPLRLLLSESKLLPNRT